MLNFGIMCGVQCVLGHFFFFDSIKPKTVVHFSVLTKWDQFSVILFPSISLLQSLNLKAKMLVSINEKVDMNLHIHLLLYMTLWPRIPGFLCTNNCYQNIWVDLYWNFLSELSLYCQKINRWHQAGLISYTDVFQAPRVNSISEFRYLASAETSAGILSGQQLLAHLRPSTYCIISAGLVRMSL